MICDYGDCANDPKAGTRRVTVRIAANRINDTSVNTYCCLAHAALALIKRARRGGPFEPLHELPPENVG